MSESIRDGLAEARDAWAEATHDERVVGTDCVSSRAQEYREAGRAGWDAALAYLAAQATEAGVAEVLRGAAERVEAEERAAGREYASLDLLIEAQAAALAPLLAARAETRTVTTASELAALPVGSVVRDADGLVAHKTARTLMDWWWTADADQDCYDEQEMAGDGPYVLLYRPDAPLSVQAIAEVLAEHDGWFVSLGRVMRCNCGADLGVAPRLTQERPAVHRAHLAAVMAPQVDPVLARARAHIAAAMNQVHSPDSSQVEKVDALADAALLEHILTGEDDDPCSTCGIEVAL